MNELTQEFGKKLADSIGGGYKFVKSKSSLVKKMENGVKSITLDFLPSHEANVVKLAMHAHIRLDELENRYGPYHLYLGLKERKDHPSLVKNCDEVFSNKDLAMSFELDSNKLNEVVTRYAEAIRQDVLPFLDEFYSVDALVASFEQIDPSDWVSSDRLTRYLILLSAYSSRLAWKNYEEVAEEFLEYCSKPHAQAYEKLAESVINGMREKSE